MLLSQQMHFFLFLKLSGYMSSPQFTSSVTLHVLLNLAESQFPQLKNRKSKIYCRGLSLGSNSGTQCLAEHIAGPEDIAVSLCCCYCCSWYSCHDAA